MRSVQPPDSSPRYDPLRDSDVTFPADEVLWGVSVRPGFDELDDPFYHRGLTQHAYLEGHDDVALCGFRPPLSGPRHRRRPRLSLPSAGANPMCGTCARRVVAPRTRVAVPVQPTRPAVAVPVANGAPTRPVPVAAGVTPRTFAPGIAAAAPVASAPVASLPLASPPVASRPPQPPAPGPAPQPSTPGGGPISPWVRRASVGPAGPEAKGGLLSRGIRPEIAD